MNLQTPNFFYKSYIPLKERFNSVKVALLISQLEYWFSREKFKEGFFKFLEPCSHPLCKPGDSWAEQLGWKRDLFKRIFDSIGQRYNSKTAYLKALNTGDPFHGKLYVSYYHRKSNRTFFLRNHAQANTFFSQPKLSSSSSQRIYGKQDVSSKTSTQSCNKQKTHSLIKNNILTYNSSLNQLSSAHPSQEEDIKLTLKETLKPILNIWQQVIGPIRSWVHQPSFLKQIQHAFSHYFHNCLDKWDAFCRKIASSKFLMGEVSSFKAWIIWAIKPEVIQRIEDNGFTFGDRETPLSPQEQSKFKEKKETLTRLFETLSPTQQDHLKQAYLQAQNNPGIIQSIKLRGWTDPFILNRFKDFCLEYLDKASCVNFKQEETLFCSENNIF